MVHQETDFPRLLQFLREMYEERIPFNRVFDLQITSLKEDDVCIKIDMKDELIGNYEYRMLHGGVISSVLDLTGGVIASMGVLKTLEGHPLEEITKRLFKLGTIDLRVDFLRPGRGNYFLSTGAIMRMGNKVVVIRSSLHNDQKVLIAVGTGTYMLG